MYIYIKKKVRVGIKIFARHALRVRNESLCKTKVWSGQTLLSFTHSRFERDKLEVNKRLSKVNNRRSEVITANLFFLVFFLFFFFLCLLCWTCFGLFFAFFFLVFSFQSFKCMIHFFCVCVPKCLYIMSGNISLFT